MGICSTSLFFFYEHRLSFDDEHLFVHLATGYRKVLRERHHARILSHLLRKLPLADIFLCDVCLPSKADGLQHHQFH